MTFDLTAAARFMTTHARLLDRRRFDLAVGQGGAEAVLAALGGYRNADGGYGWGLEPDLRSAESQPVGALHALEVLQETGGSAGALCDWLESITLPDGGLPFALPIGEPAGTAPWWAGAEPARSSLHLTTAIVAAAHRVGEHDTTLRKHRWLAVATDYCWRRVSALDKPGGAYELRYVLWFLDAVQGLHGGADAELARVAAWLPGTGVLPVEGGAEGEALRPLDIAPTPGRPLRALLPERAVRDDLARVAASQRADGGCSVDFVSRTEAGALEWRGHATVNAVKLLREQHLGESGFLVG
jgi:hypothetical protein